MINFDALILKGFIEENKDFLTFAAIKKIQQPSRREIVFTLRNNGENRKLYININPEFFHICFAEDLQKRGIEIPNAAPMFCMLLRKYLQNAKITKVIQPHGERIAEFHFEYKDALENIQRLCLAAELMGKYSNIILYNFDTKIILGCAHNVGEEKSKHRELSGNLPYIYPVRQDKKDISQESFETFSEKLSGNFDETSLAYTISNEYYYITIPLVKQLLKKYEIKDIHEKTLKILFENLQKITSLQEISPSITPDYSEYSLAAFDEENIICSSINEMTDRYFEYNQIQKILKQKKLKIFNFLEAKRKKYQKQITIFETKLPEKEKAEIYKIKGDILMMNINEKISPKLTLLNPYDGKYTEIEIDTRFSVVQNANRYYKLYKKTKAAVEFAESKISEIKDILNQIEEQIFYTEIASTIDETEEISEETGIKKETKQKKNTVKEIKTEMYEKDGFKIYVGKNSAQNDYLLSKIAKPEDLWFHPLNMHGAHVILKRNNSDIPEDVLLYCAKLTKKYSKAKNDTKIPVIYTERKYVKKANSKIAFVTYKNEKEIYC